MVASTFAMGTFIDKGVPREKLRLNPYGVDLAMFRREPKRDAVFRVLVAGTVSLRKGVQYLLEAMTGVQHSRRRTLCAGCNRTRDAPGHGEA